MKLTKATGIRIEHLSVRAVYTLTFSVRHLNAIFVLRVLNFFRDGPLNHWACLALNIYKL
jgi:hypothetical protein